MATSLTAPTLPLPRRGASGVLSLLVLLLGVLGAAAALTVYLLRTNVLPVVATPRPAAYALWYRQGDALMAAGSDGSVRRVAALPTARLGAVTALSAAPDGRLLLIAGGGGTVHPWLLAAPAAAPQSLALPPAAGAGWRYLAAAWPDNESLTFVLARGSGATAQAMLAKVSVEGLGTPRVTWTRPRIDGAAIASLSPSADQLALIDARAGSGSFAGQVAVRLQHMDSARRSIALRYFGTQLPAAVLWSPDGGTVAVAVPGQGLAIQKSSGRLVRQVPDGQLPAAFSVHAANLAYVSGNGGNWQIHVLNLHGEIDHQFTAPGTGQPAWLSWTPDARALLCVVRGILWQIDPGAGTATRLPAIASAAPLVVVTAGR